MFHIRRLWIVFTFLLSMSELALCRTAFAKDALSVDVQFENAVAGMASLWPSNEVPGIRSRIQAALVDHLSKNFGPWTFSSSQPSSPVGLLFRVVERIPNEISMALELRQGTRLSSLAQEVWLRPADVNLQGLPVANQADTIIGKGFVSLLLERQKLAIQQKLQDQVPLALGGQWNDSSQSPQFLVVLPLSWDKYQQLRSSVFRLACEWPGHGEAELESMAPGSSATFKPSLPESPYQALVVVPQWRVHLGNRDAVTSTNSTEVRQLNPKLIFLKERREPMLWDLFNPGGN